MTDNFVSDDPRRIHDLYEEFGPLLLSKMRYLCGDGLEAEDLVQEAFLKLWQQQPPVQDRIACYKWLYRVGHNAAIDRLRSKQRYQKRHSDAVAVDELRNQLQALPEDRIHASQIWRQVAPLLDEREAAVLAYAVVDGMSNTQIASFMGVSRRTVIRTWTQLRSKLSNLKGDYHGEPQPTK